MNDKITKFHTISRKYFIDILTNIRNRKNEISEHFNVLYKRNNGDSMKSFHEFEKGATVRNLINELNNDYPNWSIREEILQKMLNKIESKEPEEFDSMNRIKEFVLNEINDAEIDKRHRFDTSDKVKIKICNDEKKKFHDYITHINEDELHNIEFLFYRKVLSESEIVEIKKHIEQAYHIDHMGKEIILCFKQEDLKEAINVDEIINILRKHQVNKVYQINTGGIDTASYIMNLSVFNPYYVEGFNIYWCSEQMDWILINDHEGYYIIYGQWLIEEIKKVWEEWNEKVVYFS